MLLVEREEQDREEKDREEDDEEEEEEEEDDAEEEEEDDREDFAEATRILAAAWSRRPLCSSPFPFFSFFSFSF